MRLDYRFMMVVFGLPRRHVNHKRVICEIAGTCDILSYREGDLRPVAVLSRKRDGLERHLFVSAEGEFFERVSPFDARAFVDGPSALPFVAFYREKIARAFVPMSIADRKSYFYPAPRGADPRLFEGVDVYGGDIVVGDFREVEPERAAFERRMSEYAVCGDTLYLRVPEPFYVLAVQTADGVHRFHRRVVDQLPEECGEADKRSTVACFSLTEKKLESKFVLSAPGHVSKSVSGDGIAVRVLEKEAFSRDTHALTLIAAANRVVRHFVETAKMNYDVEHLLENMPADEIVLYLALREAVCVKKPDPARVEGALMACVDHDSRRSEPLFSWNHSPLDSLDVMLARWDERPIATDLA